MNEIAIKCPETGNPVTTGIECDADTFRPFILRGEQRELSALRKVLSHCLTDVEQIKHGAQV